MQLAVTAFALTVVCAIAGAAADEAEQQQIAVDLVKQRTLATESVTAVCGNMSVIKYDHTFEVQSTGTGEFGFLDRGHGFWRVDAAPAIPIERRCNGRSGKPYAHREMVPYHVRWYADEVYDIDDAKKSYLLARTDHEVSYEGGVLAMFWSNLFCSLRNVDGVVPFLPGQPNKSQLKDWSFIVTREADARIWLRAVPHSDSDYAIIFQACDLCFQKQPIRLLSVRCTEVAGTGQTVFTFADIEFNPPPWPEPDLSTYEAKRL